MKSFSLVIISSLISFIFREELIFVNRLEKVRNFYEGEKVPKRSIKATIDTFKYKGDTFKYNEFGKRVNFWAKAFTYSYSEISFCY